MIQPLRYLAVMIMSGVALDVISPDFAASQCFDAPGPQNVTPYANANGTGSGYIGAGGEVTLKFFVHPTRNTSSVHATAFTDAGGCTREADSPGNGYGDFDIELTDLLCPCGSLVFVNLTTMSGAANQPDCSFTYCFELKCTNNSTRYFFATGCPLTCPAGQARDASGHCVPATTPAKALAVAQNKNGALEVFYTGTNDVLYHNWQNPPGGAWVGEQLLGTPTTQGKALVVGQNKDGRLEVFYIGTDSALYHNWQDPPGGAWHGQNLLGHPPNRNALAVAQNEDGRLEIFYIGTNSALYNNWQDSPGGAWVGEHLLSNPPNRVKALAVARNSDGRLEVFYIGTNDLLYHNWQDPPGGTWCGEYVFSFSMSLPFGTVTTQGKALAVARNANGALEVFYIGRDDVLYHNWQDLLGGAWVGQQFLGTPTTKGKALAVGQNKNGALEVFYIGANDVLYHNWQNPPGGAWVGQHLLGTPTTQGKALAVARNANGALEVFYIGTNDVLYHNWQNPPGGAWVGQHPL